MSSLRAGADLSYVATTSDASPIIKSYSPELIVLPILYLIEITHSFFINLFHFNFFIKRDVEDMLLELQIAFSKIHSIVIGPGLGRSETSFKALKVDLRSFDRYF